MTLGIVKKLGKNVPFLVKKGICLMIFLNKQLGFSNIKCFFQQKRKKLGKDRTEKSTE
jgi:hypothetical protein